MKTTMTRRLIGVSMCAGLVITGITPALGAGEPTTAVTTKLPAFMQYVYDADVTSVNYRAISGTVTNVTTDDVNLRCLHTLTGNVIELDDITPSQGKWSGHLDLQNLWDFGTCRVIVVPNPFAANGTAAEKLAAYAKFTGPTITVNKVNYRYYLLGGPVSPWSLDASLNFNGKKAVGEIWSSEDGGLWGWQPRDATTGSTSTSRVRGYFYHDSGYAVGPTGSDDASMTIDGVQAFTTYSMGTNDLNMVKKSSETVFSVITDPKTGANTFTQTNPLFKCTKPQNASTVYGSLQRCPNVLTTKLPVSLVRTIKVNADGNVVNVLETFKALDKKAHTIRYDNYNAVYSTTVTSGYRYAKTGNFVDQLTEPKLKLASYGFKYDRQGGTTNDNPIIQVVYSTVPTTSWMSGSNSLYSRWNLKIPKGINKSVAIKSGATLITDETKAAAQIALAAK